MIALKVMHISINTRDQTGAVHLKLDYYYAQVIKTTHTVACISVTSLDLHAYWR